MSILTSAPAITFVLSRDPAALAAFYREILGLRQISEDAFAIVFDLNGTLLRLTRIEDHTPGPHTVLGWKVSDIAQTAAALKARGVRFEIYPGMGQDADGIWTAPGGSTRVAWFLDPEGNNLSLTQV